MLKGIGCVAQIAALHEDGTANRHNLGGRDGDAVIKHVIPGVGRGDIVGIRRTHDDIREGITLRHIHPAGNEGSHIRSNLPCLEVGVAAGALNGPCQDFQQAVMVQIGDGIGPDSFRFILPEGGKIGPDQVDLCLDRLGICLHGSRKTGCADGEEKNDST